MDVDYGINQYKLDDECIRQPKLYHDAALQLAEAERNLSRLKIRRDILEAELDKDIRNNPEKYEVTKITETVIEHTVMLQENYQKILKKIVQAEYRVSVLKAAVFTCENRKKMLEVLSFLAGGDFYSEPKLPRSMKNGIEEKQKKEVRTKGQFKPKG